MSEAKIDSEKVEEGKSSYGAVLKSSSLIGGSQAVTYAIRILRTKAVAVLIGSTGVGLIGIYNSLIQISTLICGMGLTNSGVKEIAAARGAEDTERVGQIQLSILRSVSIIGVIGALTICLLSPWISELLFSNRTSSVAISFLSVIVLLRGLNIAQTTSLSGFRRVGDVAKINIIAAIISSIVAVGLYYWIGERGVVPALILIALFSVLVSWRMASRLKVMSVDRTWATSLVHSRRLIGLGVAIAYGGLVAQFVPFFARVFVVRFEGLEANGVYVAAWAISGMFAQFILQAMSVDYFPRLCEVVQDTAYRDRVINEQTEMGIFMALPMIVGASVFAPLAISMLYTADFAPASELLPWFMLGVFARLINWPMGMIVLARGASKTFAVMQTISVVIHVGWLALFYSIFGLVGLAMAFALHNVIYGGALYLFLRRRYQFACSDVLKKTLLVAVAILSVSMLIVFYVHQACYHYTLGTALLGVVSAYSLVEMVRRVGSNPSIAKLTKRMPKVIQTFLRQKIMPR